MKWRIGAGAAVVMAVVTLFGGGRPEPAAATGSCNGPGWLCFYDNATADYGNFVDHKYNWGDFGWDDRADLFLNQNVFCSVRVYANAGWTGASYSIDIGELYAWSNVVSSNYWCV